MCWFLTVGLDEKRAAAIEAIGRGPNAFGVRASLNPLHIGQNLLVEIVGSVPERTLARWGG